jgi:hypothetical protein
MEPFVAVRPISGWIPDDNVDLAVKCRPGGFADAGGVAELIASAHKSGPPSTERDLGNHHASPNREQAIPGRPQRTDAFRSWIARLGDVQHEGRHAEFAQDASIALQVLSPARYPSIAFRNLASTTMFGGA